jgi:hypothetical protein
MKRRLMLLLVMCSLFAIEPPVANAQFFKKIFGKKSGMKERHDKVKYKYPAEEKETAPKKEKKSKREQRRKEKEERKRAKKERKNKQAAADKKQPVKKTTKAVTSRKKNEVKYPPTVKKSHYRIDVIAPLYLDELVQGDAVTFKDKVPEKAAPGLAFYQGVKLAADSLQRAGFNMDVYIHDAGSFNESSDNLIEKRKLDSSDLIIGAVTGHDVPGLAAYAKARKVNFVSALSAADGNVKDNQYFTLLQPTLKSHCEWLVNAVAHRYPGQKIGLLYRTTIPAEDNAFKYITDVKSPKVSFVKLQCNAMPGYNALNTLFDTVTPNVIIMAILDTNYADSLMKKISTEFPVNHFDVYGMPSWYDMGALTKTNAFKNMSVHVSHPFYVDYAAEDSKALSRRFKKEYGGKPSDIVFRGYETVFWYASLLKGYGTIFNEKYSDVSAAPFTKFEVSPQFDKQGFILYNENRKLYHSVYERGNVKTE